MKKLVSAFALACTVPSGASANDPVTFQLDWIAGGEKAWIFVCTERGFCEDAGIDVSIETGRGSSEAITKLATGISDVGICGLTALMAARANENVPVTAVMSVFNKGPHAFFTLANSGIEQISDIKGATIASSPFTSSNLFLPQVLANVGLTMDDLRITNADPGALGPMLVTGQTKAIIAWLTDSSRYANQAAEAGQEVRELPWSEVGLDLYETSLIASDRFLTERPDVARRFIDAFYKSVEYIRDNPEDAALAVVEAVAEIDFDVALASLQDSLPLMFNEVTEAEGLGVFDPGRLAETWRRVHLAQDLAPDAIDPEAIVDRSFLPGA